MINQNPEIMASIVGKFFKHYKCNKYYVINLSRHTETMELQVNYISLHETPEYPFGTLWSRPLDMWSDQGRFIEIEPSDELYKLTVHF
jgi:hypothetical protein